MVRRIDVKKALEGLNIDDIAENVLRKTLAQQLPNIVPKQLDEAYIAQPKTYDQVTEAISQGTKDVHKRLYEELVASLNRVSIELDAINKPEANDRSSRYRSLRIDEARLLNAVWLHELFFANCFDPHSTAYMDSPAYLKFQRQWGTFDAWQDHFIACAMAGSSGFVATGFNCFLKQYTTTFVEDYSQNVQLGFFPVLVVDMHEHARMDFGPDAKSYLISMMQEIRWSIVDERVQKAEALAGALK